MRKVTVIMKAFTTGKTRRSLILFACAAVVLGAVIGLGVPRSVFNRLAGANAAAREAHRRDPNAGLPLVKRSGENDLVLSDGVAKKMGLRTTAASLATRAIDLPCFQGVLALDNDRLSRVHSRFAGEIVELGHSTDGSDPTLRVGDRVQRGDLLAVIWSADLGQKKSELVNALTKLKAEEQLRDRLKKLFEEGAGAGRNYRDAEKDVQSRLVEAANIERTLRTWRLSEEDIAKIRAEAARFSEDRPAPSDQSAWARVEIRAPMTGVILEKNAIVGDIVDVTTDLFKIGDLSRLAVWIHVYEEDLPLLETLPRPIRWTISMPSRPGERFPGTLDKVGAVINPAQHTALFTGHVDNPSGELKVGQLVSATIQAPPPPHELELPAAAVVEDGQRSLVFVQSAEEPTQFERRSVRVARRFRDAIYVDASKAGGVRPGEKVVTSGAIMLQNAMDQLAAPSRDADL